MKQCLFGQNRMQKIMLACAYTKTKTIIVGRSYVYRSVIVRRPFDDRLRIVKQKLNGNFIVTDTVHLSDIRFVLAYIVESEYEHPRNDRNGANL